MRRTWFGLIAATAICLDMASTHAETLAVPEGLISLGSKPGQEMLFASEAYNDYFPLTLNFVTQQTQSFCGVASLVMVLNALAMPAPASERLAPFSHFDQDNFFSPATEAIRPREILLQRGMTLDQLGGLAGSFGLDVAVHHAADSSLDEFRKTALATLADDKGFVLVNYLRKALGQETGGHISPLGAYDADTDRFLILDVSRYKYPPVWVGAAELFAAMNTTDSDNDNKTRGYVIVAREGSATAQ